MSLENFRISCYFYRNSMVWSSGLPIIFILDFMAIIFRNIITTPFCLFDMLDKGKVYSALTCGNDHLVKIWQLTLWKKSEASHQCAVEIVRVLNGHSSTVTSVCFADGGTLFASTSMDKTTRLWQVILS